jgi:hypothetical protein
VAGGEGLPLATAAAAGILTSYSSSVENDGVNVALSRLAAAVLKFKNGLRPATIKKEDDKKDRI